MRRHGDIAAAVLFLGASACGGGNAPTAAPVTPASDTATTFPGFDTSLYPGDAAMHAWLRPASPYYWSGFYLLAPCHRDGSWSGKLSTLTAMGWGVTAIYVGQQDWTQIPIAPLNPAIDRPDPSAPPARESAAAASLAVCSASLLTAEQGAAEAADAVSRMGAEGFPAQSVVFLDVEFVNTVTPALLDYYRAWLAGVLKDGRYQPGVYAAKTNATTLYTAAADVYKSAGKPGAPPFWIASSQGFSITAKPAWVGLDFAKLWQGMFDVTQTWSGTALTIDVDIANARSPSLSPAIP